MTSSNLPGFLSLAVETRLEIYQICLLDANEIPEAKVYGGLLSSKERGVIHPLTLVNRQIRQELTHSLLHGPKLPYTIRVTHQGNLWDSISRTSFLGKGEWDTFRGMTSLRVEIWAARHERPVETLEVWENLRYLRNDIKRLPGLRTLAVQFVDNSHAAWRNEETDTLHNTLSYTGWNDGSGEEKDLMRMVNLLRPVRAEKVTIDFQCPKLSRWLSELVSGTARRMQRKVGTQTPLDEAETQEASLDGVWDSRREFYLLKRGAEIAHSKLVALAAKGKLSPDEFVKFMTIWSPNFWWAKGSLGYSGLRHLVDTQDEAGKPNCLGMNALLFLSPPRDNVSYADTLLIFSHDCGISNAG
ncbi:uncharacterized protein KY384_005604 [Bacidia gigantensis]|uniref:uncharacterized protein n=1 Tax=Bacidia gigantensis TaxID=2732470 RepID=UPI001D0396F6|nr:uncharacterized protein KY384_005604 [Bacidia gigantensis]KAG8530121.1 hypothetical protein KY384_005604 [Bacidia gigantensis]